jgi:F0F1-type ATP synthase assembly protein I
MHREIGRAAADGVEAASFFASIMAGLLLGFVGDTVLGTRPALIVVGIIAGSVTGFWRMWTIATRDPDA